MRVLVWMTALSYVIFQNEPGTDGVQSVRPSGLFDSFCLKRAHSITWDGLIGKFVVVVCTTTNCLIDIGGSRNTW